MDCNERCTMYDKFGITACEGCAGMPSYDHALKQNEVYIEHEVRLNYSTGEYEPMPFLGAGQ